MGVGMVFLSLLFWFSFFFLPLSPVLMSLCNKRRILSIGESCTHVYTIDDASAF